MDLNDTPPSYLSISLCTQNNSFLDAQTQQHQSSAVRENFPRQDNEINYLWSPSIEAFRQEMHRGGLSILYNEMIAQREEISKNREKQENKLLQENYPIPFVIGYSIFIVILSIIAIVIQILMIFNQSHNYQIGAGIWVGCYLMLAATLALAVSELIFVGPRFLNLILYNSFKS